MESKYSSGRREESGSKFTSSSAKHTSASPSSSSQSKPTPAADSKPPRNGDYVSPAKKSVAKEESRHVRTPSGGSTGSRMSLAEEKEALNEIQEVIEADDEFEKLKNTPKIVTPQVAKTTYARRFVRGFKM